MLGFTTILTTLIQALRIRELQLSNSFRKLLCVRVLLGEQNIKLFIDSQTNVLYSE